MKIDTTVRRSWVRSRHVAFARRSLALALALACRAAAPYDTFQLDASASSGYSHPSEGRGESFTEVRPALTLAFLSPRVTWRAGYVFAGQLTVAETRTLSVANELSLTMASELSNRNTLLLTAGLSQGGAAFQLTHKAPDAGEPSFRAPSNPALVTATFGEAYQHEASERLRVRQALTSSLVAPQDALGRFNASVMGSVGLVHELGNELDQPSRDVVGAELRSGGAVMRSSSASASQYWSLTNGLVAHWTHDFTPDWSGQATGGVEQVLAFTGSYPLALLPTGSLIAQYTNRDAGGALTASYGAATDLQTGTVSVTQSLVMRGFVNFQTARPRSLGASVGLLHAEPLGQTAVRAGAGIGYAAQGDVGLFWGLSDAMLATARYAIAYQFAQPAGIQPLLTHVLLVGFTMRYSRDRALPPAPALGARADGTDRAGFPEIGGKRR